MSQAARFMEFGSSTSRVRQPPDVSSAPRVCTYELNELMESDVLPLLSFSLFFFFFTGSFVQIACIS